MNSYICHVIATVLFVASPLLAEKDTAHANTIQNCRAECFHSFLSDVQNFDKCHKSSDCYMCWSMCELLVRDSFSWSPLCELEQKQLCPEGCAVACQSIFGSVTVQEQQQTAFSTEQTTQLQDSTEDSASTEQPEVTEMFLPTKHTVLLDVTTGVLQANLMLYSNTSTHIQIEVERLTCQRESALPLCDLNMQSYTISVDLKLNENLILLPGVTYNSEYRLTIYDTLDQPSHSIHFLTLPCTSPDSSFTTCHQYRSLDVSTQPTPSSTLQNKFYIVIGVAASFAVLAMVLAVYYIRQVPVVQRTLSTTLMPWQKPASRKSWTGSFIYLPQHSSPLTEPFDIV